MKMTKIESARLIVKNKGKCHDVLCEDCFRLKKCNKDGSFEEYLIDAESYIKRHEGKSRKKDHIRDTTKKVEEPKPVEKPTPLEIAKMIRDNGYKCTGLTPQLYCHRCVLARPECVGNRKKLIDDYISANDPKPVKTVGIDNSDVTLAKPTVKENLSVPCEHLINGDSCGNAFEPCEEECPANSEYPDPIRVDIPDIFYCPTPQGILRFKRSQILLKDTNNDDCLLKYHEEYPCYRTIEEAVIVAKKMWNGDGK